jgi:Na+/H+ antiporter NhaD/arsenite permease-like protein
MVDAGFTWFTFLIAVNLLLLLGGQFMEPSGLLLIVAPVVFPIAMELGVDPIHLGIIMVVNMEIGMITPPIGLNLFVTSGITGMSLIQVVRAAAPFVAVLLVFLMLVTYMPVLSTALPYALMGPEISDKEDPKPQLAGRESAPFFVWGGGRPTSRCRLGTASVPISFGDGWLQKKSLLAALRLPRSGAMLPSR